MKRTLSLLLVLALCLAFLPAREAAAADNPFDKQDNKMVPYSGGLYFGFDASETLASQYKPHITVDTLEYDTVPSGEIAVNITLSGDDLDNHWSASGLHIGYDTRLTLVLEDDDILTPGPAIKQLSKYADHFESSGIIFAATAGSSDKGRTGVMYTLHFTLPANAKAGDVYPIGIYYDGTDSGRKDLFTNVNQDEVGRLMQSYLFYTGITNGGIKIKSNNPPVILAHPVTQTVTEGNSAQATFTFMLENSSGCTYRWEYRKNSSDTWKTEQQSTIFSDSGCGCYASGWGSSQFSLQPISRAMNGWQFRCKVTNSDGSVYTNVATLTVNAAPITSAAATITAPAVGAKPDYSPVLPSGAKYYSEYYSNDYYENYVGWQVWNGDGWNRVAKTSVFQAGETYRVCIFLTANSGESFSEDCTGTVNGKTAFCSIVSAKARLIYEFPTLAAGGWKKDSKGWWYQRADGTYPKNQWEKINGKWYHFDANGYMQTGWLKLDGKWYYFNPGDDGSMVTGWKTLNGKKYYFNLGDDGSMVTGWKKLSGKWYYFNTGNDGSMVTGWQTLNGKRYYFSSDGSMMTGWQKLSGKWYYFKPGDDGSMVTGWQTLGGKKYYFNSDGSMATGWQKLSGKWYYFAPGDSGYMLTGWQKLSNKWYYFNSDGSMATGWKKLGTKWYYFLPGDNGQMVTGWKQIDGDWYYFMPGNDGSMVANTTMTIDGKSYTFASNGVCTNP